MTVDGVLVLRMLFSDIIRLFFFTIPGTNVTPFMWSVFAMSLVLVLKILKQYFMGGGPGKGAD